MADFPEQHEVSPADEIPDLPGDEAPASTSVAPPDVVSREQYADVERKLAHAQQLLNEQQRIQQSHVAAPPPGVTPEMMQRFQHDPYTVWLGQQMTPLVAELNHLRSQADETRARVVIDSKYGRGVYDKYASDVDQEAQLWAQAGRPVKREDLVYQAAAKRGDRLEAVSDAVERDTRAARRREKAPAMLETGAPARKATEATAKPLSQMSPQELEAKLRAEIAGGKQY